MYMCDGDILCSDFVVQYTHLNPTGTWFVFSSVHRDCLRGSVVNSNEPEIKCPFDNGEYVCGAVISEREIKAVSGGRGCTLGWLNLAVHMIWWSKECPVDPENVSLQSVVALRALLYGVALCYQAAIGGGVA